MHDASRSVDTRPEWPRPLPAEHRGGSRLESSRHRQNAAGDLVIPLGRGEIVALPRLWGFTLDLLTESIAVLRGPDGLTAEVALLGDGAVVERVAAGAAVRRMGDAA